VRRSAPIKFKIELCQEIQLFPGRTLVSCFFRCNVRLPCEVRIKAVEFLRDCATSQLQFNYLDMDKESFIAALHVIPAFGFLQWGPVLIKISQQKGVVQWIIPGRHLSRSCQLPASDVSVFNLADIVYQVSCCSGPGAARAHQDVIYLPVRVRRSDGNDFEG
jgi:hypothetical protein